eukprot:COSAG05_NODE_1525_length_4637_cov_17.254958_2_plen_37_part_00
MEQYGRGKQFKSHDNSTTAGRGDARHGGSMDKDGIA